MNNKEVFEFVQEMHPDFIDLIGSRFYLIDKGISIHPVTCSLWKDDGAEQYNIFIQGQEFTIQITGDGVSSWGSVRMDHDFGLSDDTCMELYKYGLVIMHSGGYGSRGTYDRVAIERRYNIKSIING